MFNVSKKTEEYTMSPFKRRLRKAITHYKQNAKEMNIIFIPVLGVLFAVFLFTGFLLHETLNPLLVFISRFVIYFVTLILFVYSFYMLWISHFILPIKKMFDDEREENNENQT